MSDIFGQEREKSVHVAGIEGIVIGTDGLGGGHRSLLVMELLSQVVADGYKRSATD
jgi:hypothetical protein